MRQVALAGLIFLGISQPLYAVDLATVNGKAITDRDLQAALSGFSAQQKKNILQDSNAKTQIVENLVDQEVLVQVAQKERLQNSKEFKQALESFRRQTLANLLIQKKIGNQVNPKNARAYYRRHKTRFRSDQVRAQHILLSNNKEAKRVLALTKKKNADFQSLAQKHSIDLSAKNNRGEMGYFTRDRHEDAFSEPVFRAKRGQVIGPIKTSFGYHIVKIVDRKNGSPLEYGEVELRVLSMMKQDLVGKLVNQLKKNSKIKLNLSALK